MKPPLWTLVLLASLGCSTAPPPEPSKPQQREESPEDLVRSAAEDLFKAQEAYQFREGLHQFETYFNAREIQPELQVSPEDREFLKAEFHLSARELKEVQAGTFRPLDQHHLEACFLFREIGRTWTVGKNTSAAAARQALEWVCRQLVLEGPAGNSWLPTNYLVERGFGTPQDRALVLLDLLRQLHLEGFIIQTPHPLVAVRIPESDELALFDPRLGKPVGKNWNEVLKQPDVLKAHGITPEDFAKARLQMSVPLSALAPRMRVLQRFLQEQDSVVVAVAVRELQSSMTRLAGRPVEFWNDPITMESNAPNSPTRCLWFFLPAEDGGLDRTRPLPRLQQFRLSQMPIATVYIQLRNLGLLDPQQIHSAGGEFLRNMILDVFQKFSVQPRRSMLRGQQEAVFKRLERTRTILEVLEFSTPNAQEFQKEVLRWRTQVNQLALDRDRKAVDAEKRWQNFWAQDQYLVALLQPEMELDPRAKKGILGEIVFAVAREPLGLQTSFLTANTWQDRAEILENQWRRGESQRGNLEQKREDAWLNTRSAWTKFVEPHALSAQTLKTRLSAMRARWQQKQIESDFHGLLKEWSLSCAARLQLARAWQMTGSPANAQAVLEKLDLDLQGLAAKELQQELDDCLNALPPGPFRQLQESLAGEFRPGSLTTATYRQLARAKEK